MKKFNRLLFFIFSFSVISFTQHTVEYKKGLPFIDSIDIKFAISFLASDSLKGRGSGTNENLIASRFIAKKFNDFGLKPYLESKKLIKEEENQQGFPIPDLEKKPEMFDNYFQKFNVFGTSLIPSQTKLIVKQKNPQNVSEVIFNFGKDFFLNNKSLKNLVNESSVVFLGYGIDDEENGYSDFYSKDGERLDLNGKIVLIVEGFPRGKDSTSVFFKSKNPLIKNNNRKAEAILEKGALAVLICQSPLTSKQSFITTYEGIGKSYTRVNYHLPEIRYRESGSIAFISSDVVNEIFSGMDFNLYKALEENSKTLKSISFEINDKLVRLESFIKTKIHPTQNVIGFLEGSDPVLKDEFIVIGAHLDHVGLGNYGAMNRKDIGMIHNGADDNASGTSAIIEIAEAFSKTKPKRSIIFIAFNAEEMGLLGSRYYAYQHPFKEIKKTIAMVNLDMIGRCNNNQLWIGGVFYGDDIKKVVEETNKDFNFTLLYNVGLLTFGSDQGPFIRMEIPSVFFFTGLHDDYHTPNDDIDKINFTLTEKITKLAFITSWKLANNDSKPKYRELDMNEKINLVKDSIERQKNIKQNNKK